MYFYQAYGLNIHSVIELPELLTTSQINPDISINFGKVDRSLMQVYRDVMYLYTNSEQVSFAWDKIGAILIKHGKEIIIDPLADVEQRLLRLPLLGMALGVILYQRGLLTLHASAVEINGSAAIFTAGKGWGKSTLAATLYNRGHRLIADDLVAVDISNPEKITVIPSFPQLKLLPEAAMAALGRDPNTLPTIAKGYEKRAFREIDRLSQHPIPLKGIYRLDEGSKPALKLIPPQEAIVELIGSSFIALCADTLLKGEDGVSHFRQCAEIVKKLPVYRLERPQALELVPALAELVENHLSDSLTGF